MPSHVDLSHTIDDGMETYPGLPVPRFGTHLSRDQAEQIYGPGVTFHIGIVEICTNTGTYLDMPFHRFADGDDLAALNLDRVADVPAVCFDRVGQRAIELSPGEVADLAGYAVLIRTDDSDRFGTPAYAQDNAHLTATSAEVLVDAGVACVGIDSINIDNIGDPTETTRPVHTTLLGAGIPIIEHLTNLRQVPDVGFEFSAVPPKLTGVGTFTVRAYATLGEASNPRLNG